MRRNFILAATAALVLTALAGCAARPQLRTDRDPTVDLRSYKTFAFFDRLPTDNSRYSSILTQRLKLSTRYELEKQGYAYSETNPDLRVNLLVKVAGKREIRSSPLGGLGYRRFSGIETTSHREGSLGIDLVDARRNALVWQGVAEGRLDAKAAKDPGPVIEETVRQIFAAFPAGAPR